MNNIKIARTLFILSVFLFITTLISAAIMGFFPGVDESFKLLALLLLTLGGPLSLIGMLAFGTLWGIFAYKKP